MDIDSGMKEYLRSLQATIENQEATIENLRAKNKKLDERVKEEESKVTELTDEVSCLKEKLKTETDNNENLTAQLVMLKDKLSDKDAIPSLTEEITKAAEEVVHEQFIQSLAYEKTTGLYYDYKTGYYYDSERRLFYDGEKGKYLEYNHESGEYIPCDKEDSESVTSLSSSPPSPLLNPPEEVEIPESDKMEAESVPKLPKEDLSEGEISSPSPPPPMPKEKKKKNRQKDYENFYYLNDKRSKKRRKREMRIPCIRLVVQSSQCDTVSVGTLFIVTCKGASIGREGTHDVLLEDVGCSKHHGDIHFDEDEGKYFLSDRESRNGTFVDGNKLKSRPKEIGHGSLIGIGSTKLICHVHPGLETCLKCEPGVIISSQPKIQKTESKEMSRKEQLQQMRKKYGLKNAEESESKAGYFDRAEDRRKTKGSDNPYEKTEMASTKEKISESNKGFKMLKKMGWKETEGLGKGGRLEPVNVEQRPERQGLGAQEIPTISFNASYLKRMESIRKTQERFNNLE